MQASGGLQSILKSSTLHPRPGGLGYLGSSNDGKHPFCANAEGWGPLSRFRYDFTPCFLDVWISSVAVFGVLFGAGAIWYLLKWRSPQPVRKNWHYYLKLIIIGALIASTLLQAALQIGYYQGAWLGDFRFWTSIFTIASLAVIFTVQFLEHTRSRNPNGVVLFYWLFMIIAYAVKVRSLISQQIYERHLPFFFNFCVGFGLASLEFVLEYLVPKRQSDYDALGDEDECPMEYADVFSILTFGWMTPMMKYGYNHFLTEDDLWNLRKRDTTSVTGAAFEGAWGKELQTKRPSLWMALFRGFSGPYFRAALFKVVHDVLAFVQPQLLRLLISFVDSHRRGTPQPIIRGAAIALAMFTVSVLQTICLHQYFQRAFETGMRLKSGLTTAIYQKSLRLSNEGRAAKSTGDIVNLMAVDTQRLHDLTQYGQQVWSAPLQIVLCMASLYHLVGLSMLAGIGAMIIMIPVNGLIARFMKTLQKEQMKNKDARTRLMTEILNNMKSIKLYAWGAPFMSKLNYIRNDQELKTLRKIGAAQAFFNFAWSSTPFLVSCSTFMVFVLTQEKPLTTEIVFPALTLFNLLTFPLAVLPMVITSIVEASVAVGRLTSFFTADELQVDAVTRREAAEEIGDESVRIRDATFTWNKDGEIPALQNIDFSANKGELSCIVGRVGAGKSSLLQAMLGDLWKICGGVEVRGDIAYVAQQAWVMNASVKENIVFGHRWDPNFYNQTVRACALLEDFESLPDGDRTEVGERGISLSGGQKTRLTLARAVYARADIYLLDDVLSAVDQHVGRHLTENVLGSRGLLSGKTRILATNSIPVLIEADHITLLKDGKIVEAGNYDQVMANKEGIASLVRTGKKQDEEGSSQGSSSSDEYTTVVETPAPSSGDDDELKNDNLLQPIKSRGSKARQYSSTTLRRASAASFKGPRGITRDEEGAGSRTKQSKEHSEQGKVKWNVYSEYANNLAAVSVYIITLIGAQTAQVGGSVWLKQWSETNGVYGGNPEESLGGISTIRAYRQQNRFALENEWRMDANLRAYFPSINANRWLAVRLEFIGSIIILGAAGFAVIAVSGGSALSAGMVGLAMSYALQITQSLNWIVRQTVEVETNIVSVERVLEYARLPSEAPEIISRHRPNISWPAHGAVSINNYSTRYRQGLDLVLKNINLNIRAHEKIGVVGRTGAGKSSLTLALFRIIEPVNGNITIDALNTSTIGLLDLRRRLSIIPQDAALFEGTIRDNLDPGHVHDDTELWSVLGPYSQSKCELFFLTKGLNAEHARLKAHVATMTGRLDARVHEGGSNLSQGQRQLVSLARALLTPSNILVLDEATAAVDVETDALLQATLRSNIFSDRTIITIAHRINTILDSDRIIVLDHGTVAEFDTPSELVRRRGLFYELVREADLLESVAAQL
ncbi:hypothetical protein FGG08_005164 [Glutinoglossum americanum]|uniref:Multidrug resistance-associated protein 1 n=1 Tax=Glutinoglossum americanum TaxID=1670608 RepID=A0A9P8KWB4_9PEZI|nr:hypothetical protein FGG08_005164 [Glutinoglossum americanum]